LAFFFVVAQFHQFGNIYVSPYSQRVKSLAPWEKVCQTAASIAIDATDADVFEQSANILTAFIQDCYQYIPTKALMHSLEERFPNLHVIGSGLSKDQVDDVETNVMVLHRWLVQHGSS
jgi:tRNA A37 threonylcarbamoyladenosine dehydratase